MKWIYNYHPVTGIFLSSTPADVDPLEPDRTPIPAHATDIEPPATLDGQVAIFVEDAWRCITDQRGRWFNGQGQSVDIYEIEADVDGLTRTEPPGDAYDLVDGAWVLNSARELELANLYAERQRASAYQLESDPIFFKWQRGEGTKEDWLAAVEAIKTRFPKAV